MQKIETTPGQEPLSPALNMTMDLYTIEPAETETCRRSRITSSTLCSGSVLEEDHYSLIRGMQGYEVTPADLVFLKRARQERQINALQRELDELLRQRRNQMLARDLSLASREKIQTDLDEILSCEQTVQMGQVFLSRKLSSTEVEALDSKSLLAQIKTADVQQAVEEEQAEITALENSVARALELRERGEQRQQEIENRNRAILTKKANIKHLMKELSELKSQLAGAEESLLAIQGKVDTLKDTEKEEDTGPQEALQVAPSQAKAPKKAPKTKRNGGETITQQASHVRIKAENTPTIVGEPHMASGLRRSTRIATKKSCVENKPVLRKTHPVKASISL
nr:early endosome antigen 1-like isoform X2 [Oncorhynchus nerka]